MKNKKLIPTVLILALMTVLIGLCSTVYAENTDNTCLHQNRELISNNSSLIYGAVCVDEKYHELSGEDIEVYLCNDCGEEFNVRLGRTFENELAEHYYEDGSSCCMLCNYQNSCSHPEWETLYRSRHLGQAEYVDQYTHKVLVVKEIVHKCTQCGAEREEPSELGTEEEIREHRYENDVCVNCGYTNACPHPAWETRNMRYSYGLGEYVDEFRHKILIENVVVHECTQCGMVREEPSELGTQEEIRLHYSYDDVCTECDDKSTCPHTVVCIECGYESTCLHPIWEHQKRPYPTGQAEYVDERTHKALVEYRSFYVCGECGAEREEPGEMETLEEIYTHNYENGICTECGGVNSCL